MSVIVTGMDLPSGCLNCKYYNDEVGFCNLVCNYIPTCFTKTDKGYCCPLKSIDGLIKYIKDHSYPVRYDTNSIEQGMTITGIEQAIKEYCEVSE